MTRALIAAVLLLMASAALAIATSYATVTGYAAGTPANNHVETWEAITGLDCTKEDGPFDTDSTETVEHDSGLIIVKAGSERSAPGHVNTLFGDVTAGETVFADSNGSGAFDEGDKAISHIIFCKGEQTEPTPTPTPVCDEEQCPTPTPEVTPTPTPEVTPTPVETLPDSGGGDTPLPTLPQTNTKLVAVEHSDGFVPFWALVFLVICGAAAGLATLRRLR